MPNRKLKILFVAFPFSLHTARWISNLEKSNWDIHLFSSIQGTIPHNNLGTLTFHEQFYNLPRKNSFAFKPLSYPLLSWFRNLGLNSLFRKMMEVTGIEKNRSSQLRKLIGRIRPDIIHSLETQHAGYLVGAAKSNYNGKFPLWIHSNWGIDLHFFGKLETHLPIIREMLSKVNIFITEGNRDEQLARQFGFSGKVYTFPSVGGGFMIPKNNFVPPSARKKILLKGSQDIVRRCLVAMRALERCIDVLQDYEILLYSSNEITQAAAEIFLYHTGKKIVIIKDVSQAEMLALNAEARINICVNKSDGVPNAMLEAMLMGAFPIQSNTSMADEWLVHEKTGILVPPEDPEIIECAIRKALENNKLVDEAAVVNRALIEQKLEYNNIRNSINEMYLDSLN